MNKQDKYYQLVQTQLIDENIPDEQGELDK